MITSNYPRDGKIQVLEATVSSMPQEATQQERRSICEVIKNLSQTIFSNDTFAFSESLKAQVQQIVRIFRGFFKTGSSEHRQDRTEEPQPQVKEAKLVIIGSGPAGYTAALYAARANLEPIVFEGSYRTGIPGGQLMTTTEIENYPGFPEGINGSDLMNGLRKQAQRFGANLIEKDVTEVDFSTYPLKVKSGDEIFQSLAVIIATGAVANRADIEGTRDGEFWQKGVSACAVCDGALPLFRNRDLYVIGGGDSAIEEALFLSKFASKVYIVHRREKLRASKIMQQKLKDHPKIEVIWNSVMTKVEGDTVVRQVRLKDLKTQQETVQEAAGVFFAIGHTPNTAFLGGQLAMHQNGYVKVTPGTTRTNIPFVYAAGDVQDSVYRQAITAAGTGCMAALEAERDLESMSAF